MQDRALQNREITCKNIFTAVSRNDDEQSTSSCKKDSLRCMLSSGSGRCTYMSLHSISRARMSMSSYNELVLINGTKDDRNGSTKA